MIVLDAFVFKFHDLLLMLFHPYCSKNGSISYKAQSQDEDALVHAAAQLNMIYTRKNGNFLGRDILNMSIPFSLFYIYTCLTQCVTFPTVCWSFYHIYMFVRFALLKLVVLFAEINFNGSIIRYELLEVLEFTSDRKRMSVVVKDTRDGKILLLSKGADEAMLPCASSGSMFAFFFLSEICTLLMNSLSRQHH